LLQLDATVVEVLGVRESEAIGDLEHVAVDRNGDAGVEHVVVDQRGHPRAHSRQAAQLVKLLRNVAPGEHHLRDLLDVQDFDCSISAVELLQDTQEIGSIHRADALRRKRLLAGLQRAHHLLRVFLEVLRIQHCEDQLPEAFVATGLSHVQTLCDLGYFPYFVLEMLISE